VPHFSMVPSKGENKTEPGSPIQSSRQATTELTLKTRNMTELLTPDMRNGYMPLPTRFYGSIGKNHNLYKSIRPVRCPDAHRIPPTLITGLAFLFVSGIGGGLGPRSRPRLAALGRSTGAHKPVDHWYH